MEVSNSSRPFPPLPDKPAPLREAQESLNETAAQDSFKAIEESAESAAAKAYADNDTSLIEAEAQRFADSQATDRFLQDRIQPQETPAKVQANDLMERYQASEEGSRDRASHRLDEVV